MHCEVNNIFLHHLTIRYLINSHFLLPFLGLQEEKDGLFDTIQRNKSHYQKRAYQCIKMLVTLFSHSPVALKLLHNTPELKKKWVAAVNWLNEELDRRSTFQQAINQYAYNWSPPAQSNETSNGYYLERSNSAKLTLSKAFELCPQDDREDTDDQDASDDVGSPPAGDFDFAPGSSATESVRTVEMPDPQPIGETNDFAPAPSTSNPAEQFSTDSTWNWKGVDVCNPGVTFRTSSEARRMILAEMKFEAESKTEPDVTAEAADASELPEHLQGQHPPQYQSRCTAGSEEEAQVSQEFPLTNRVAPEQQQDPDEARTFTRGWKYNL